MSFFDKMALFSVWECVWNQKVIQTIILLALRVFIHDKGLRGFI